MRLFREVDAYKTGQGECKMRQEQCVVSNEVLKIGQGPESSRAARLGSWNGNSCLWKNWQNPNGVWKVFFVVIDPQRPLVLITASFKSVALELLKSIDKDRCGDACINPTSRGWWISDFEASKGYIDPVSKNKKTKPTKQPQTKAD